MLEVIQSNYKIKIVIATIRSIFKPSNKTYEIKFITIRGIWKDMYRVPCKLIDVDEVRLVTFAFYQNQLYI